MSSIGGDDRDSSDSFRYLLPGLGDTEDVEKYHLGGFHPVHIGDKYYDGRYQIVHKLGSGGFATVWLAHDLTNESWVALKIVVAKDSALVESQVRRSHEIISRYSKDPRFVTYQHYFYFDGPNGHHLCLVLPVLGPSAHYLSQNLQSRIQPWLARSISSQVARALEDLHGQGLCHGDLTTSNIIFQIKSLDCYSKQDIYRLFGHPETAPLETEKGDIPGPEAPRYIVKQLNFLSSQVDLITEKISLIDFDQAFPTSSPPKKILGTPVEYMAPEIAAGRAPSPASDVWALVSVIMRIRSGVGPFAPIDIVTPADVIFTCMEYLGNPPSSWGTLLFDQDGWPTADPTKGEVLWNPEANRSLKEWINKIWDQSHAAALQENESPSPSADEFASADQENAPYPSCYKDKFWKPSAIRIRGIYLGSYSERTDPILEALPKISEDEAALLYDLLSKIFVYEPSERPRAGDLLGHPWFNMDG